MDISNDDRFQIDTPRVVAEMIDGEVLVIDLGSGAYHQMVEWSAYAWCRITGGTSPTELAVDLASHLPELDASEIVEFIRQLLKLELLTRRSTEPPDGPAVAVPTSEYAGLRIETFTDMSDLILLDPVHEIDPRQGWPTAR